jgi:hypothetical protein
VRASKAKHVIAIGKVLEGADKVKGSDSSSDALQVTKSRGVLTVEEIARIVEPFR